MERAITLDHGDLCRAIELGVKRASESRALQLIPTDEITLTDQGVEFLVRRATNGNSQPVDGAEVGLNGLASSADTDLYLGGIGDTHHCVLKKSSIYTSHLLLVTQQFEPQETLLRMRDFVALSTCLREYDGIGFYDAGPIAGAKGGHKHLQLVSLPLSSNSTSIPIATPLSNVDASGTRIRNAPGLPFAHAFGRVSPSLFDGPLRAGEVTYDLYVDMMEMLGMHGTRTDGEFRQTVPYNLLITRNWMLLIPRIKACFQTLSIDGLAFAGSLLVDNQEQVDALRKHGPMSALTEVSRTRG